MVILIAIIIIKIFKNVYHNINSYNNNILLQLRLIQVLLIIIIRIIIIIIISIIIINFSLRS